MARCIRTTNLEVHHKRRDGDAGIDNAEVLCHKCHVATSTFGVAGESPPEFSDETKAAAKKIAAYQCQCTRIGGCH